MDDVGARAKVEAWTGEISAEDVARTVDLASPKALYNSHLPFAHRRARRINWVAGE